MSRVSSMTIGLVLIFIGAQLYLVKSYLLTPAAAQFVQENFDSNNESMFATGGAQSNGSGWLGGERGNNGNTGNAWNGGNGGAIGQAAAGQKWPYYRTDGAGNPNYNANFATGGGPFSNSSFQQPSAINKLGTVGSQTMLVPGRRFVPPQWIMWPALFLGAVFFLHGVALRG